MAKAKKGKRKAKVETEDEEEEKAGAPVLPALGDVFDQGNVVNNDVGANHTPQVANDAWGIVPGDSASNVNSNRGGWGGATAAPTPPPKRASIIVQHDPSLAFEAMLPAALTAQLQQMQQQQEMNHHHNIQQNIQQQEKKQRGRQKGSHGREAAADNMNDGGWSSQVGGGWGVAEEAANGWPQPASNGDTWGMPPAVMPGGFGGGFVAAGQPAAKSEGKRGNKKKVESSPSAVGGWTQEQRGDAWDVAAGDSWGIQDGADGFGDTAAHQHQHPHHRQHQAQASGGGGGWNTGGGGGGGGGWGVADTTGTGWGTNAAPGWPTAAADAPTGGDWGMPVPQKPQAPSVANTSSWGGWRPTPEHQHQMPAAMSHGKIPKVTIQAPSSVDAKTVVSAKQHTNLISTLLGFGRGKGNQANSGKKAGEAPKDKRGRQETKTNEVMDKRKLTPQNSPWVRIGPDIEEEEEDDYDYDYDDDDDDEDEDDEGYYDGNTWMGQNTQSNWVDPGLLRQSKAYTMANGHTPASRMNVNLAGGEPSIIESYLIGLETAKRALYSRDRLAKDRIHWLFDPRKDQRVSSVLDWIDMWKYDLARFGLSKFVEQKERGALFVNVDYRDPRTPYLPAFDFLTYKDIQETFDRTLQESLAFYDPLSQVLVFVFLLSKSRNSMAIWRRKIVVTNDLKTSFRPLIAPILDSLTPRYPIFLDEPIEAAAEEKKKLSKKKWLRWGKS